MSEPTPQAGPSSKGATGSPKSVDKGKGPQASPTPEPSEGAEAPAIAVDPDFDLTDDGDSAFGGSGLNSSTASLSESILEYRKLNGRTFHNFKTGVEYWGPNDDKQNEGLDIAHHMLYLALDNKLFLAPLDNPHKVLDVGTGTGIWAIDFADEFPSAEVIGTDLSPIQPMWVPPNCKFELDDAQQIWTYPDDTFDYIHIRCLMGSIKDWTKLYRECFRCLKPGGWVEHLEFSVHALSDDNSISEDSPWKIWPGLFIKAGELMGQTFQVIDDDNFVHWMADAGFPDVKLHKMKIPMGSWPADKKWKEVGAFSGVSSEQGLEGFVMYCLEKLLGWSFEEVQVYAAKCRKELRNRACHAYYPSAVAYAQKPAA